VVTRLKIRTLLFFLLTLIPFFVPRAFSQERDLTVPEIKIEPEHPSEIVLSLVLNHENKGEFFVYWVDGDFLMRVQDLTKIGFANPIGVVTLISGEPYLSIQSLQGVSFLFHERELSLELVASPEQLQKRTIDLSSRRQINVRSPNDNSAFLNYRLDYTKDSGSNITWNLVNQMGIRHKEILFLSDSSYTRTPENDTFVRLMSNLTYDRKSALQRVVLGDLLTSSGELGSGINMGGFSFSKAYQIDPYFIKNPVLALSGLVSLPSDVEIYLNGVRIRRERLSPGAFELSNLSYYGGAGLVEVVIRDAFGREQRIKYPVYFTNLLLKQGLHEYSYIAGFLRNRFGLESNEYDDFAVSGFHRYGVSDTVTLGVRGEAVREVFNLGSHLSYSIQKSGVASVAFSGSGGSPGQEGGALFLDYGYQGHGLNAGLLVRRFTRGYMTVGSLLLLEKTRAEYHGGISYGKIHWGTILADFNATQKYVGADRKILTIGYSKDLLPGLSTSVTFRDRSVEGNEFFVGLNFQADDQIPISSNIRRSRGHNLVSLQAQKDLPVNEGYGFRMVVEAGSNGDGRVSNFNPTWQYAAPYGLYEGEYRDLLNVGTYYRLSASGAIVSVGNRVGLIKPVTDSFGLVSVGDIPGVGVSLGGEEIGKTDSSGKLFIPHLTSYYNNAIGIDDRNIPIDYTIPKPQQYISPPLRSGSCIVFHAVKQQYLTGRFNARIGDQLMPVEFYEMTMKIGEKEILFPTGKGGEFYFENSMGTEKRDDLGCRGMEASGTRGERIPVGQYEIVFDNNGVVYQTRIDIPQSDEMIIDLGEVVFDLR
jgi:outer membrane usher protein FimD/PapC